MKRILEFLQEENGNFSAARLNAFLAVLTFITDWQYNIWSGHTFAPSWQTVAFVLSAVGSKLIQKFVETKNNIAEIKNPEAAA